jgi:hypothetical protein
MLFFGVIKMSDVDPLRNYARITDVTTPAGNTPHELHMRTCLVCVVKRNPAYHSVD